jgi:hypothetical protein
MACPAHEQLPLAVFERMFFSNKVIKINDLSHSSFFWHIADLLTSTLAL